MPQNSASSGYNSLTNAICATGKLQGRLMWCDAEANLRQLSTRQGVRETVRLCKEANITTMIVDVKPLAGLVLYKSSIAPRMNEWEGFTYPADYDLLQVMTEECRSAGLEVYAAVNVFAEGSQARKDGPAYAHLDWQCVQYELDQSGQGRLVPVSESGAEHLAVFVNPALPDVREYELSIINEIVSNYNVDGIVLDRMRYPNIFSDFSQFSKTEFEKWSGSAVANWPEDVYRITADGGMERGPIFKDWLEWRARNIRTFVEDVRRTVKGVRVDARVGVYVGSWYSEYYGVGVNWGSPEYAADYDWMSSGYHKTGYADLFDFICTGCYYEIPTRAEAASEGQNEEATVEAAGETSIEAVRDETFVYASLYVRQYEDRPDVFKASMAASVRTTQGLMIFDLCYIRDYDWWNILKEVFPDKQRTPHTFPGLIEKIKDIHKIIESS